MSGTTVRARILFNQERGPDGEAVAMLCGRGYKGGDVLKPATSGWLDLSHGYGEYPVESSIEATRALYRRNVAETLFRISNCGDPIVAADGRTVNHRSMSVGDVAEVEIRRGPHYAHVFYACMPQGFDKLFFAPARLVEEAAVS